MLHRLATLCVLLLCLPLALCDVTRADEMIWFSAHDLSRGDVSLNLDPETTVAIQGIRVTSSETGTAYLTMGLPVPQGAIIDSVVVCYVTSDAGNPINQIRFTRMTVPRTAVVLHDIPVALNSTTPTCAGFGGLAVLVEGSVSLSIRLDFNSTAGSFDFGGIGIHTYYPTASLPLDSSAGDLRRLQLKQNHPNPFHRETAIEYAIARTSPVSVQIHDASGRLVRDLVREEQFAGEYHVTWDGQDSNGNDVPAGKYFYHVRIGDMDGSKGMILIR